MRGSGVSAPRPPLKREVSRTCSRTIQSSGIRDENNGGEGSFSRRRYGAGREQIRESFDRVLPGNDGARAFWPEAAKNLPLAGQQFRAGKCPRAPTDDPCEARQAAHFWRRVRDWESRNAPHERGGAGTLTMQQA